MKKFLLVVVISFLLLSSGNAQRIKDIGYFKGTSSEHLIGYGLVTGLAGTGDGYRSTFTMQSVTSMLKRFGITVPNNDIRVRNVAAVMVTARINNNQKEGAVFDINVSSLGDATSLTGGILLQTPLSSGRSGQVFGFAEGPLSIGGYDFNTQSGGRLIKNHPTSGRVPGGGMLSKAITAAELDTANLSIVLRIPDYTTANNVAEAINKVLTAGTARALDAGEIKINVPADKAENLPMFMAQLEAIQVLTDAPAKVVLNERTGTIVAGSNVKILPVTISYGSLKISVKSFPLISQPSAFSQGQTQVFNNQVPFVESEDGSQVVTINGATNVQEIAAALNTLKVNPRDVIGIFQAIKEAGALPAELVIM